MRAQITQKIGTIRDPETGEFPTVIVRGDSIDKLTLHVEGSPKLVALVKERLGIEEEKSPTEAAPVKPPRVFLRARSGIIASGPEFWPDSVIPIAVE
jgi:hypothetical protein